MICDRRATTWDGDPPIGDEAMYAFRSEEADNCADAIRKLNSCGPQKESPK